MTKQTPDTLTNIIISDGPIASSLCTLNNSKQNCVSEIVFAQYHLKTVKSEQGTLVFSGSLRVYLAQLSQVKVSLVELSITPFKYD